MSYDSSTDAKHCTIEAWSSTKDCPSCIAWKCCKMSPELQTAASIIARKDLLKSGLPLYRYTSTSTSLTGISYTKRWTRSRTSGAAALPRRCGLTCAVLRLKVDELWLDGGGGVTFGLPAYSIFLPFFTEFAQFVKILEIHWVLVRFGEIFGEKYSIWSKIQRNFQKIKKKCLKWWVKSAKQCKTTRGRNG